MRKKKDENFNFFSSILTGLYSFMMEDKTTYGSIETTDDEKRSYALKSHETNSKNKIFTQLFPEIKEYLKKKEKEDKTTKIEKKEIVGQIPIEESNSTTNWLIQLFLLILFCSLIVFISL